MSVLARAAPRGPLSRTGRTILAASVRFASTGAYWGDVAQGPPDAIFGLTERFKKDTNPNKINLGVGAYKDNEGKSYVLNCVRKAEQMLLDEKLDKDYATIAGVPAFNQATQKLAFGEDCEVMKAGRIATAQSISGTGGLRIAFDFMSRFYNFPEGKKVIHVTNPTWGNHHKIIADSGCEVAQFRYINAQNKLDLDGMLEDLNNMPNGSAVLLHACAHNPTGVDPTQEQWDVIADVFEKKSLFPFFDMAYQGFASGDPARDAYAVRMFTKRNLNPIVIQSYSKNLGLYGERAGAVNVVTANPTEAAAVFSQLKIIIRPMYSNPPVYGARIANKVLNTPELQSEWMDEIVLMSSRIEDMRHALVKHLKEEGSTLDWSHIESQIGMFCYSGLSKEQVNTLIDDHHIYLTQDGRISMAGVSTKNVKYLAKCMHAVTSA